jgi:hypothetical protein
VFFLSWVFCSLQLLGFQLKHIYSSVIMLSNSIQGFGHKSHHVCFDWNLNESQLEIQSCYLTPIYVGCFFHYCWAFSLTVIHCVVHNITCYFMIMYWINVCCMLWSNSVTVICQGKHALSDVIKLFFLILRHFHGGLSHNQAFPSVSVFPQLLVFLSFFSSVWHLS